MTPFNLRRAAALGASLLLFGSGGLAGAQVITTVSGNGTTTMSGDGGPALAAGHGWVTGVARDGLGNMYVVEYYDYRIRKIAPDGTISTFAGNGQPVFATDGETNVGDGGPATAAAITPHAVAADAAGNVYFTDQRHHRVRKVTPGGVISTIAGIGGEGSSGDGGKATLARLGNLHGIAMDGSGNVYISAGHGIRKIGANGIITRLAGDTATWGDTGDGGPAVNAYLHDPAGLAADQAGNVFVADSGNERVRRITPAGVISTVMGGGPGFYWTFDFDARRVGIGNPVDVAVDSKGYVYSISSGQSWVRKVSPDGLLANGGGFRCPHDGCGVSTQPPVVEGGDAFQAYLSGASSIEMEPGDSLLVANEHYRVRRITTTPAAQPPKATDVLKPFEAYPVDSKAEAVATGDFDGDGRADVVVVTRPWVSPRADDFKVLLYRQQPDGTLSPPAKSLYTTNTWDLSPGLLLVDLNHDGRKDIVVARGQGLTVYLGNAGGLLDGQAVDVPKLETSYQLRAVSTDIDADGHADIIVAARDKDQGVDGFWIFKGTGAGLFQAPTFLHHPQNFSWWSPNELRMGDLNGDGRDDLLVGGLNGMAGIYFHDGAGSFKPGVLLPSSPVSGFSAGDADDDGRDDVLATRNWVVPALYFYRQDAGGRLDARRLFPLERSAEQSLLADLNGDGRSDLLLLDGASLSYLQRSATGYEFPRKYFYAKNANVPRHPESIAVGRLDNDDCLDVATVSDAATAGLMIYRGQHCLVATSTRDVDADGRNDVAWVAPGAEVQLWPGADRSKSVTLQPAAGWGLAAVADFGGDGRADLLWRNCVNGVLSRWDGFRATAATATSAGPDRAWRLAATADFDGDGRADLLWRHASGATERWPAGDRARRQRGPKLAAGWSAVASGDFDGDGRADVFWRHAPTGANLVWRAGGSAGALRVTSITDRNWQVAGAGDTDGDGRADVFWRHRLDGRNALWPAARFAARRELQSLPDSAWSVAALQDVDGDRRADVLWHHASGLGMLWKRADPALAFPAAATPRGWQPFERGFDGCVFPTASPAPAAAGASFTRPVRPVRRGID
jgi:hypothetical protein